MSARSSNRVYAAIDWNGFYFSEDHGFSWRQITPLSRTVPGAEEMAATASGHFFAALNPDGLYHSVTVPGLKRILQRLDHAAIFLLIAGTYTPFTLVNLRGGWGWTLFGMVWSIAIAGTIMELVVKKRYRRISIGLYLGLGWLAVSLAEEVPEAAERGRLDRSWFLVAVRSSGKGQISLSPLSSPVWLFGCSLQIWVLGALLWLWWVLGCSGGCGGVLGS